MDDLKSIFKQYWPYIVGGIAGLWLIMRYMGGSSGGSSGYGEFLAYNAQAAAANQQAQLQNSALQAQIDAAERQSQREYDFSLKQLDLEQQALNASATTAFIAAQSEMAASVSQGAAGVIASLSNPSIAAINAAAAENIAAMDSAAFIAASGYVAQSDMVKGTSSMIGKISDALGGTNNAIAALASRPDNSTSPGQFFAEGLSAMTVLGGQTYGAGQSIPWTRARLG